MSFSILEIDQLKNLHRLILFEISVIRGNFLFISTFKIKKNKKILLSTSIEFSQCVWKLLLQTEVVVVKMTSNYLD